MGSDIFSSEDSRATRAAVWECNYARYRMRLFGQSVIFAVYIVHGKAKGESLLIAGLRLGRGVQFARILARFRAHDIVGAAEAEQITELGGIEKIGSGDSRLWGLRPAAEASPHAGGLDSRSP